MCDQTFSIADCFARATITARWILATEMGWNLNRRRLLCACVRRALRRLQESCSLCGVIAAFTAAPDGLLSSPTFRFGRAVTYEIMNVYAYKMAAVFMVATSTLALRTGIIARWIAYLGYTLALGLLFSGRSIDTILMVFPLWVLLVSVYFLVTNFRKS